MYSFSIPSFRSVELKLFVFLQLEAFSCLSIPFLPPYWIDFVAFLQLEIFLPEIISFLPSCWIEFIAFFQLEACSFASISFVSFYWIEFFVFFPHYFLLFCWIEIITFFQLEACSFLHFLSSILLNCIHCFLSDWNILFEIISFFPSCWIEFIAFYSARSLFVREHFVCLILLNWIHCILSAFLLSVLLNRNHDFLSATSLFVPASPFFHPTELTSLLSFSLKYFRLTSFLFFQASGWKKAMRSIQQNGRKQMLTEEHAFS